MERSEMVPHTKSSTFPGFQLARINCSILMYKVTLLRNGRGKTFISKYLYFKKDKSS